MPFPQLHQKVHKAIMIVDDDMAIRESLKMLLEVEGYLVFAASSAEEALSKLKILNKAHRPFLVITDLMMPGMNGEELAQHLEEDTTLLALPVAIMTASEATLPGRKVIRKPFSIDAILRVVYEACVKDHNMMLKHAKDDKTAL